LKATSVWEQACDRGSRGGCFDAALAFQYANNGGPYRPERASALFRRACSELKYGIACRSLGRLYADGSANFPRDTVQALALYRLACDYNFGTGCREAAWMLWNGRDNLLKDTGQAVSLFKKGCDLGDRESCDEAARLAK